MKKYNKLKLIITSLLVLSLSFNNFAAVVSDNDGSAFISKTEFDSLKSDFQAQIDNYNSSIDSKIDEAIAAYLSGIRISSQSIKPILFPEAAEYGVISIDKKNPLDYAYGFPRMQWDHFQQRFKTGESITSSGNTTGLVSVRQWRQSDKPKPGTESMFFATKSVITKLVEDKRTTANSIAQWEGYRKECDDLLKSFITLRESYWGTGDYTGKNGFYLTSKDFAVLEKINEITDVSLLGQTLFVFRDRRIDGTTFSGINMSTTTDFYPQSITHDWGTNIYPFVSVLQDYKYDMFSNKDRDRNFYYPGTYMRYFKPNAVNETYDNQFQYKWSGNGSALVSHNVGNPYKNIFKNGKADVKVAYYNLSRSTNAYQEGKLSISSNGLNNNNDGAYTFKNRVPLIGFETKYLTNWKQIYLADSSSIAAFEKQRGLTATSSILTSPADSSDVYLGLTSGFPIMKLEKNEKLKFDTIFDDLTKNYVVWVSKRPFSSTGHPDNDSNCLELKGLKKASNTSRGYLVEKGKGAFETPKFEEEGYVYIKWGVYNDTLANIGGGLLKPTGTATVTYVPN